MDLGLHGARVLVAASSRGLGAAAARQFSLEGARVVINGRDADRLGKTAQAMVAETGGEVFQVVGNVSSAEDAARIVAEAVAYLGGLDVLVTNAGGPPSGRFDSLTGEQWEAAYQLTVMSAVRLIQCALPHLRQSDRAAILTITSVSVKEPIENLMLSNSLRMSVIGLTKTLARELGPDGIRVNSILPGWTLTERVDEIMDFRARTRGITVEEAVAQQAAGAALGRLAQPDEFARVAVFLASPAASYMTGAMVPVDGGSLHASL